MSSTLSRDWSIAGCFAVATIGLGAWLSISHPPLPHVHDEFSYLLAADTFANGRLTNPPHPLWRHFETIHVLQQPTYASKYPPGQGLLLAVGQVTVGWPIAGVWLMSAVGVLATYWMLRGWVAPRWAAAGTGLLVVHHGYQLAWGQCYWGGTLAFTGGALVLGAVCRLRGACHWPETLLLGLGALILANTRPFEGLVLCLLAAAWLLVNWWRTGWPARTELLLRGWVPLLVVAIVGALAMLRYNYAVTGNALRMPYQLHEQTYGICPLFLWQSPRDAPEYVQASLAKYHQLTCEEWYQSQQTLAGLLKTKGVMLRSAARYLFPPVVALTLLLLPWWRGRKLRGPLLLVGLFWLLTQVTLWNWPHYLAPGAPLLVLLLVYGLRNLNAFTRRWWPWQVRPATLLLIAQAMWFAYGCWRHASSPPWGWQAYRAIAERRLQQEPGKDLVLVQYTPAHTPEEEWVYNRADIDSAEVIWAHDRPAGGNQELLDYFSDRKVWRLAADLWPPRMQAVVPQSTPQADQPITPPPTLAP